ncbi:MAG: rhodanese-like domain-containing protein [Burkholderiales bacterium]
MLFIVLFMEQAGLPLPALPFLLAAGALAAGSMLSFPAAVTSGVIACVLADAIWYEVGRRRGSRVLGMLCRVSLEPDSCVRRTEATFAKLGIGSLVIAKFVPGLSTVAPPLAGVFKIKPLRFLFYDGVGSVIYVGSGLLLGYLFGDQIEMVSGHVAVWGKSFVIALGMVIAGYVIYKYVRRRRFLHSLRIARISVQELQQKLDSGESVVIIDLRHPLDIQVAGHAIPGALYMAPEEIEQRHHEIPRDCDVVLYCSCPSEVTSARIALLLRNKGILRVRPLAGGFEAWRDRALPLIPASIAGIPPP